MSREETNPGSWCSREPLLNLCPGTAAGTVTAIRTDMRDWTTFTNSLVALPEGWRMILFLINCNSNSYCAPELEMGHSIPLLLFPSFKALTDLSDMTVLQSGWKMSPGLAPQSVVVQEAQAVSKDATWTWLADVSSSTVQDCTEYQRDSRGELGVLFSLEECDENCPRGAWAMGHWPYELRDT